MCAVAPRQARAPGAAAQRGRGQGWPAHGSAAQRSGSRETVRRRVTPCHPRASLHAQSHRPQPARLCPRPSPAAGLRFCFWNTQAPLAQALALCPCCAPSSQAPHPTQRRSPQRPPDPGTPAAPLPHSTQVWAGVRAGQAPSCRGLGRACCNERKFVLTIALFYTECFTDSGLTP